MEMKISSEISTQKILVVDNGLAVIDDMQLISVLPYYMYMSVWTKKGQNNRSGWFSPISLCNELNCENKMRPIKC